MIFLNRTHLFLVLALLAILITPTAATVVLSSSSCTPDGPLLPGGQEHVVAQYSIIPSGATTFAKNHELQMQTGLVGARWSIQVTLDGRNAAQQNAQGSVAFVNGEILSYSTNHDVGMIVTIDGTVPQGAANPVLVVSVEELDNSGNVVPGSLITLTRPVAGQTQIAVPSAVPTLTPQLIPTTVPTRSPGFALAICGCCLVLLVMMRQLR